MERGKKIVISIGVLVILVLSFYYITKAITNYTGYSVKNMNIEEFASCLASKNVSMYGAYWCPHCQNEKKMFGDYWSNITYIECDAGGENPQVEKCQSAGISGYPTWQINNQLYPGEKTFKELADLSGCGL